MVNQRGLRGSRHCCSRNKVVVPTIGNQKMPLSLFVFRQGLEAVTDALFIEVKPHNHAVVINCGRYGEV
jgi:hypothetical protein